MIDPTRARIAQELVHDRALGACAYDPSGRWLFAGAEDERVIRWDTSSGAACRLAGHTSWVRGLAFLPDQVVTAGYDGRLIWWPLAADAPQPVRTVAAHQGWVRGLAVSPDGQRLATCGNDNLVKVWSSAGEPVAQLAGHAHNVYSVAFHPLEGQLVSADQLGVVLQWETASWTEVRRLDASKAFAYNSHNLGSADGLRKLAFSADGRQLAGCGIVGGEDPLGQNVLPGALVFDWASGAATVLHGKADELGVAWGLFHHPAAGFWAAAGGGLSAKHLYFWQAGQERPVHVLELPSAARDVALHPDGQRLAIAHHDRHMRIVELG